MRVSVVVPCYNAAPFVGQAVGSALEQTHSDVEIVVVDDGSTDGSVDVIRRSFGGRVRLLTGPNAGAPAARNRGAAVATGAALLFLDADDVLGPTALAALADALRQRPGAVAACPWFRLEEEGGAWVRRPPSCAPRRPGQDALAGWLTGWYHPPCSVLWSRAAFRRAGPWEESLVVNQDGHLMMQALAQGVPLVLTDRGEAFYRRAGGAGGGSVSGRRLSKPGLEAKLWVLERLAVTLRDGGRLGAYRHPLDEALERVGHEAEPYPEVAAQAAALARSYAGYPWLRTWRRVRRRAAAEARAIHNRLQPPSAYLGEPEAAEVIEYGLSPVDSGKPA